MQAKETVLSEQRGMEMRESSGKGRIAVTTGVKRGGWAGLALALLLPVCAAWGASPAAPGVQVVTNETYTLTLTASPDQTAICRGQSVTFAASLRCTDPDEAATNETVRINVVSGSGSGDSVSGYGSVSTSVTGTQQGEGKIAVTASGGRLSLSRSIDVISVVIESGDAKCVHAAAAQLKIDTTQSYSPASYGWSVEPEAGLDHTAGIGKIFTYSPANSEPGTYAVTANSITLPVCKDTRAVHVVKVDLSVAGVDDDIEDVAPGGLVCVNSGQTATRTALTVSCQPADWDGSVELSWSAGNIKVYNAATGGDEVTSGTTFANAALPTNLWVEGTAPSAAAGDVVFRLNPVGIDCPQAAEGCDKVVMTAVKVSLEQQDSNSPLSPINRMCSNAQDEYRNVKYAVNIIPGTLTANLTISGEANVTFDNLSTIKNDVTDGTVVTLIAMNETTGNWKLTANVLCCCCEIEEKVFRFEFKTTAGNDLSEVKKATYKSWEQWDFQQYALGLTKHASDGHYKDVWIETDHADAYTGHVIARINAYEVTAGLTGGGALAEVMIERDSLFIEELTSMFSVAIPSVDVSISIPEAASGGSANAGVALKVGELAGDGPTIDGPVEIYVDKYKLFEFTAGDMDAPIVSVVTDRTFNLSADPVETVRVSAGFAVGVSVNPGEYHKARARIGFLGGGRLLIWASSFTIIKDE